MRSIHRSDAEVLGRVAEMESLYGAGRYADVIKVGEAMCGLLDSTFLIGKVRLRMAESYLHLGQFEEGRAPLVEARHAAEAANDAELLVECMAAEASFACVAQRPEAVGLATKALVACRALPDVPTSLEVQILSCLGSSQLVLGQTSGAIKTFEDAIDRADPVVDMRRLGKLLGNAAMAYRELGQLDKAVRRSTRAVALFETLRDLVSLAREENNLGYYLIGLGELATARKHLERSMKLFEETNLQKGRGHVLLSLCELCFAQGDLDQAMTCADRAIETVERQNERWSMANARLWKGRIAARLGDDAGADCQFQIAVEILHGSGMSDRLVKCHTAYAEVLEKRGDLAHAYEQLKLAFHIRADRNENGLRV